MQPADIHADSAAAPMNFMLFNYYSGEPLDTVEMHVLAKAYRAAWRSRYMFDPIGLHVIASLGLVIDFGGSAGADPADPADTGSPFGPIRRRDWG
jgi:hypothetical protein